MIKQIKPKAKGKSDKYSWQLYEYIKRNYDSQLPNVYIILTRDKWDSENNETLYYDIEFSKEEVKPMYIWIGKKDDEGWYYGNKLQSILGDSREKYTKFASPWLKSKNVIDITDWFWQEYIQIGRCIWDRKHVGWFANDETRFTYTDNQATRTCNWCGVKQELHTEIKVIEKEEKHWMDI